MHVVLGALGTVVTLLYLLYRLAEMGIDLGGLNPFLWRRRRAWRQKFEGDPVFLLEDPRQIAALLVVGVTKVDGDTSSEEKSALLTEFEKAFSLDSRQAAELLSSSAWMLRDAQVLRTQLDALLEITRDRLTAEQIDSTLSMMERVATAGSPPTELQRELLGRVRSGLALPKPSSGIWE